jgi:hypothetical protein
VTDCTVSEWLTAPAWWSSPGTRPFYGIYKGGTARPIAIGTFTITAGAVTPSPNPTKTAGHSPSPSHPPKAAASSASSPPVVDEAPQASPSGTLEQSEVPAVFATDNDTGVPFSYLAVGIGVTSIGLLTAGIVLVTRRRGRAERGYRGR